MKNGVHMKQQLKGEDSTNNQCETWNDTFRYLVGYSHPTIWAAIDALGKDVR